MRIGAAEEIPTIEGYNQEAIYRGFNDQAVTDGNFLFSIFRFLEVGNISAIASLW